MLTFEEVKSYLDIEQKQLEKFLELGKLHAYRIGGSYLRFRKEEVENLRFEIKPSKLRPPAKKNFVAHVYDFWRFNNFYIISTLIAVAAFYWWVATF